MEMYVLVIAQVFKGVDDVEVEFEDINSPQKFTISMNLVDARSNRRGVHDYN